jgi:hypothetical protein
MSTQMGSMKDSVRLFGVAFAFFGFCGISLYLAQFVLLEGFGSDGPTSAMIGLMVVAVLLLVGLIIHGVNFVLRARDAHLRTSHAADYDYAPDYSARDDETPSEDFDADAVFARYRAKQQAAAAIDAQQPITAADPAPMPRASGFGRKVA